MGSPAFCPSASSVSRNVSCSSVTIMEAKVPSLGASGVDIKINFAPSITVL